MSNSFNIAEVWHRTTVEILTRAGQPDSLVPALTTRQQAMLTQSAPVALLEGFLLISVKTPAARTLLENELGPVISALLQSFLGRPCALVVSVGPPPGTDPNSPQPNSSLGTSGANSAVPPAEINADAPPRTFPYPDPYPDPYPGGQGTFSNASNSQNPTAAPGANDATNSSSVAPNAAASGVPHTSAYPHISADLGSNSAGFPVGQPNTPTYQQQSASQAPNSPLSNQQIQPSTLPQPGYAPDSSTTNSAGSMPVPPPASNSPGTAEISGFSSFQDPSFPERLSQTGLPTLSAETEGAGAPQVSTPAHIQQIRAETANEPATGAESRLNPNYTFETFVTGHSNRHAHAAAIAVAENPATGWNPLFIWGGSGLGKTHLLHAIGNYARDLQPGLRVKYVSSEEFINDFINSLRDDRKEKFKRRYRDVDILMVDDVQFFSDKEATQEEFFHTFNALYQANKQIILSSDRPPKNLTTLEDRLRTRFEGGLIIDVQPPDFETRVAILSKKAGFEGYDVPRDVLEYIAERVESSIRELEGVLIRLVAYSSLMNSELNMEVAKAAMKPILPDGSDRPVTAKVIIEITANYFGIEPEVLVGGSRKRAIAHARQLAMYLCRELTDLSLPKIGTEFGRDHTTVIHANQRIKDEMSKNSDTYDEIEKLTHEIKSAQQR